MNLLHIALGLTLYFTQTAIYAEQSANPCAADMAEIDALLTNSANALSEDELATVKDWHQKAADQCSNGATAEGLEYLAKIKTTFATTVH